MHLDSLDMLRWCSAVEHAGFERGRYALVTARTGSSVVVVVVVVAVSITLRFVSATR